MLTQGMYKLLTALLLVAGLSDAELTRNIQRQISNLDYGSQRPVVTVKGGVVSIEGTVTSLWLKEETINRILKVQGIESIMSDMVIAKAESDAKLAEAVIKTVRSYSLYTVYDDFQGRIVNGTVYISGAVTEPKKMDDLVERIAKVKGVQAINNKVIVLPPSQEDDRLRVQVAQAIYSQSEFERYSMADPPVHVIVNKGRVTLIGALRADIEKRKALEAARFVPGILSVEDKIQLVR